MLGQTNYDYYLLGNIRPAKTRDLKIFVKIAEKLVGGVLTKWVNYVI
jgi:hypothetical protein